MDRYLIIMTIRTHIGSVLGHQRLTLTKDDFSIEEKGVELKETPNTMKYIQHFSQFFNRIYTPTFVCRLGKDIEVLYPTKKLSARQNYMYSSSKKYHRGYTNGFADGMKAALSMLQDSEKYPV